MSSKDKLTKQDIQGPDMFMTFSEKIFHQIERNASAILAAVGLAAVLAIGFTAYSYYSAGQEHKAAEALFRPETELRDTDTKLREARAKKMQDMAIGKDKTIKVDAIDKPADYDKEYSATVAKLTEAIRAHSGTKAAMVSALNLANFLMQQKQFPAALQVLEAPKYKPSDSDLLAGFWHMHRGLAFIENQKAEDALKEYKEILDSKSLKSFHPEAWLKTGVAYELKGDLNKARETYEKVDREFKGTEASNTASQYLRLLDLKPKQG